MSAGPGPGPGAVTTILAPLALAPLAEAVQTALVDEARAFGASVVLLHVLPPRTAPSDAGVCQAEAAAHAFLDSVAAQLGGLGVEARVAVRFGATATAIVAEAVAVGADLIVMGSDAPRLLAHLVRRQVVDAVVRAAPMPVLLVHTAAEPRPPAGVRCFLEDHARAGAPPPRHVGVRSVEVARIVGSVGRARELGPDFRPRRPHPEDRRRFDRVMSALAEGTPLPPVQLYRLGYGYYVVDGNHRVAAAKRLGMDEIDAEVSEFVPLADADAQQVFAERRAFEQATGLVRVEAARPGSLARIEAAIRQSAAGEQDLGLVARRWYARTYRPLVRRIRRLGLAALFPGERSADLVARLADVRDHRGRERRRPERRQGAQRRRPVAEQERRPDERLAGPERERPRRTAAPARLAGRAGERSDRARGRLPGDRARARAARVAIRLAAEVCRSADRSWPTGRRSRPGSRLA
jgi:nucleotide-binding universal stress UspA family protein/ParB-like chromosome segregation protein Spo0J